jgi:transcriptional regulator with GAF, ATPase, and Fis domain
VADDPPNVERKPGLIASSSPSFAAESVHPRTPSGAQAVLGMIGRSLAFRRVEQTLRRLALLRRPVLVRGETGTGKELAARFVHELGPRREGPFVALNCGAIVDGLAESELFGHVKGAFTGAHRAHTGAFERAHGGTLFLDEIGELPLPLQAKLLRVLETSRVHPVGAEADTVVDARVVCATHRDLEAMVAAGRWREDLYHRLGVLVVHLPPLRERADDIPLLLERFTREAEGELGRAVVLHPAAVAAACSHPWPGNVRALKNAVLRAAALVDGPIAAEDLLPAVSTGSPSAAADVRPHASVTPSMSVMVARGDWASMNRELLARVVAEHGSIRRAARALGIPRSTLGAWLKRARGSEP